MKGSGAAVLITIVAMEGSAPREVGARMLVIADATFGTIGGGHLEYRTIEVAREMLHSGSSAGGCGAAAHAETLHRVALGPSLGQCCGGAVTLRLERISVAGHDAEALEALVAPDVAKDTHVIVFGAGHVGRALVPILAALPCRVAWIDARDGQVPAGVPSSVGVRITDDFEEEVVGAVPGSYFVVMTHSHALDLAVVDAVLRRDDFAYLGVIGSATKRAKFERRLERRGINPATIAKMRCPIGISGIDGKRPAEIAVSVAAEILVARDERASRTVAVRTPRGARTSRAR